jgi:hypothetical protein
MWVTRRVIHISTTEGVSKGETHNLWISVDNYIRKKKNGVNFRDGKASDLLPVLVPILSQVA